MVVYEREEGERHVSREKKNVPFSSRGKMSDFFYSHSFSLQLIFF